MAPPSDATQDETLPTYAQLAQTEAWAGGGPMPRVGVPAAEGVLERTGSARYEQAAVLGVGGMGKVLLARDVRIGREVAVKVLHAERELAPEERARFLREAQVQGQLEHPSIVPVYDIDRRPDGSTFFTMRRVLGRTLAQILDDVRAGTSRYTQRELLQAFATVCLTVDYAHSRGVVHRDLKPANIMLGDFGEVYVLDWGIARILDGSETGRDAVDGRLSMPGSMLGTPLYMAPEQMADPEVGPAADVFSLGAILFEILTLQRLRDPRSLYTPVDARPSVRAPDRNVAPELETVCVRATELEPEDRYPSARAVQEAIARYLEGDRELAQRRALAETHAVRARAALGRAEVVAGEQVEVERGTAMKELVRALALDPTNREHVAMLAEMMSTPPREVPAEVATRLRARDQEIVRSGTRYTMSAMAAWFLFFPLVLAAGIRRLDHVIVLASAVALTVGLAWFASRQRVIGRTIQYAAMATLIACGIGTTRIFGPLLLVPTLIATWAILIQAHPDAGVRRTGLVTSMSVIVVPLVLELAGWFPGSYAFLDEGFLVVPQMTELPRWYVLAFLGVGNVATAVIPALFVGRLRSELAAAQERELIRTWHFKRLGDDLIRASA